jgi:hypothetical protein
MRWGTWNARRHDRGLDCPNHFGQAGHLLSEEDVCQFASTIDGRSTEQSEQDPGNSTG